MSSSQEFLVTDKVRLEVQQGWPDLPNEILNPTGSGGPWGWELYRDPDDAPIVGTLADYLTLTGTEANGFTVTTTDEIPEVWQAAVLWRVKTGKPTEAGQQVRAAVNVTSIPGSPGARGTWGVRAISADTNEDFPFDGALSVGVNELDPVDLPEGTTEIWLFYLLPFGTETGATQFTDAWLVHGDAADVAASDPVSDPAWTNILGSAASIDVEREDLQVGVLSATIIDSGLDPASTDLIWPGRRFRLQVFFPGRIVDDIAIPPRWHSVIEGKLNNPSAAYVVRDPKVPAAKRVNIKLSGSDAAGPLANTPRPEGVGTLDELPYVLLGTGVPFNIEDRDAAIDPALVTVAGYSDQASVLDQLAMTRDSVLGYVWIDRKGTLQAWYRQDLTDDPLLELDEAHYSDLDVDFDVDRTFNTVEIELLDPQGTSTTFGPYVDEAAKRRWGERKATFRVLGIDPDDIEDYAYTVLGLNSTPVKRINSVTLPVRTVAELEERSLLDLYDLVSVSNDRAEISDQQSRVVGLKHRITIKREGSQLVNRWWLDLQFSGDQGGGAEGTRAAVPRKTPPQMPSFARIRSMLSGAGRIKPTDFGAKGDGETDDSTKLLDCWEALGEAINFRGTLDIDRPYGWNTALKQYGGYTVWQSTPRRLPAAGVLEVPEPGLIALGDEAQYLFGQTGDGSGSLNDNPGPVYNLTVDGAGIAGAEGLFVCDAAQSSLYDLMVMGTVADGVGLRIGRSQNLNLFNPQIGASDGIGVQFKSVPGQQGAGHVVFFGGHVHDNRVGIQISGTAGDFFPPHDIVFNTTLIESGRIADQEIRLAIELLAGIGTQFNDVNVTFGAQVGVNPDRPEPQGGPLDNPVVDDVSVFINNPAFPGYSTTAAFRGGSIGGGINKVTDAIRIQQDLAGAANKLVIDGTAFANVDNILCVDGEHGSDPDFADPIVEISSFSTVTGVGAFSRVINNGTRLNHRNISPLGTFYELQTGISNGQIQNPLVIKHEDETAARKSTDWNGQDRWLDPATGGVVGSMLRNGAQFGPTGAYMVGGAFGRFAGNQNIGANAAVTIDNLTYSVFYLSFTAANVDATSLSVTNTAVDRELTIGLIAHASGGNDVTWPASSVIKFANGVAPQPIAGEIVYVHLKRVGTRLVETSRSHP